MSLPAETTPPVLEASLPEEGLPTPPPPPRAISDNYAWRLLLTDGWAIVAFVFGLLGAIFTLVGTILTLGIITAFVGIPFAGLGLLFLGGAGTVAFWRYQEAQKIIAVLRAGEAVEGQIVQVEENLNVQINQRHPWTIRYQFRVGGQAYEGRVSTLNVPGRELRPGKRACVLYLPNAPVQNMLYPHP
jgi:hypothetical protein